MGAVAAPHSSRPAGPVSLAAAALVALAATVILLVSPGPAAPTAAPDTPISDQTAPVAFRSLGATYLSAPADRTLHLAFADVQNAGDHPITVTSVLLPLGARVDDIAIKRISRTGATFGPPQRQSTQPFDLRLPPRATLQVDFHFRARGCVTHRPVQVPVLRQPLVVGYSAGGKAFAATVRGGFLPRCWVG
ncbi:MAG TPA: hypothetical protein VLK79_12625 [Gaiellales bacterium]|nr:hypothetical protein [Gaiellales bacterium]